MSVYFILQLKVFDEEGLAAYRKVAGSTLQGVNVKALAVGSDAEPIEGDWHGDRVTLLEFETAESFRSWYNSPGYQEVVKLRLDATDSRSALVKGLE